MRNRSSLALDKLPVLGDAPGQCVGHDQRIIRFQSVNTKAQKVGLNQVVMRRPFEVLARGLEVNVPQVPTGAHIAFGAVIPNAGILRGKPPADLSAAIGRAIVGDDEFKIAERLVQNGFDGSFKKTFSIVKK